MFNVTYNCLVILCSEKRFFIILIFYNCISIEKESQMIYSELDLFMSDFYILFIVIVHFT